MSHDGFINDIHPLVRAFIPGEEIEVSYSGEPGEPGETFSLSVENTEGVLSSFEIKDRTKEDRLSMKNELKCTLYRQLSEKLDKKLPWGTLSGIRPVRLAMNHLKEGFPKEDTVRWMQDYYLSSPEKSSLAVEIALKEQRIINEINSPEAFSLCARTSGLTSRSRTVAGSPKQER